MVSHTLGRLSKMTCHSDTSAVVPTATWMNFDPDLDSRDPGETMKLARPSSP